MNPSEFRRRGASGWVARIEALLLSMWWRPTPTLAAWALLPLSALYGLSAARLRRRALSRLRFRAALPVPVIVVGNMVVGGAGKTPTVMALVAELQARGHRPGVLSRGYGRRSYVPSEVGVDDNPVDVGDEPLLIRRRCRVPVWVGRDRASAGAALCARHPQVDVLVSDDGLQHHGLRRRAELVVFDERGAGNGLLLPAGPLRELLPNHLQPTMRVLYTGGTCTTRLAGQLAQRSITVCLPLAAWHAGNTGAAVPLERLRGRPLVAVAGIGAPEKFFSMLEAASLTIERLPQPDHHGYPTLPWPAGTGDVVTTEKDAVKLLPAAVGATNVWVVPLDLTIPSDLVAELMALLFAPAPT